MPALLRYLANVNLKGSDPCVARLKGSDPLKSAGA